MHLLRTTDKLEAVGNLTSVVDLGVGGLLVSVNYVFKDAVVEDDWLLHDHGDGSSEIVEVEVLNVLSVKQNLSVVNIVEPHH